METFNFVAAVVVAVAGQAGWLEGWLAGTGWPGRLWMETFNFAVAVVVAVEAGGGGPWEGNSNGDRH